MENEQITKETIELLLRNAKSSESLDLIENTIEDHNYEFGFNLEKHKKTADNLRKYFEAIEEEMAYRMAVKNFWDKL